MASQNILITGCSSGFGLGFVQHYLSLATISLIIGIDITPLPSSLLSNPNISKLQFHKADITSESALSTISSTLASFPIHLLVHCAGVRGLVKQIINEQAELPLEQRNIHAAETYQVMDKSTFMSAIEINTFGTFNVVKNFVPNLVLASSNSSLSPAKAIVLASRMGSISANTSAGGSYAYRASKAALNAIIKSFSLDVPSVQWCLLHPGRVETGLVQWKEEGAISVEESVRDCLVVIDNLRTGEEEENVKFVDRFGAEIGW